MKGGGGDTFLTLCTGVAGGICSTAKTVFKPIRTSSQPFDDTGKGGSLFS